MIPGNLEITHPANPNNKKIPAKTMRKVSMFFSTDIAVLDFESWLAFANIVKKISDTLPGEEKSRIGIKGPGFMSCSSVFS